MNIRIFVDLGVFVDWDYYKGRLKRGRHDKHGDFLLGFLGLVLEIGTFL